MMSKKTLVEEEKSKKGEVLSAKVFTDTHLCQSIKLRSKERKEKKNKKISLKRRGPKTSGKNRVESKGHLLEGSALRCGLYFTTAILSFSSNDENKITTFAHRFYERFSEIMTRRGREPSVAKRSRNK